MGRPIDLHPLPVRDEVWLRRGPDPIPGRLQRGAGDGQHAALAVGPGDERAADGSLRVVELTEERPRPPEAEADPEAAALRQGSERLLVRHSRVSSSS